MQTCKNSLIKANLIILHFTVERFSKDPFAVNKITKMKTCIYHLVAKKLKLHNV